MNLQEVSINVAAVAMFAAMVGSGIADPQTAKIFIEFLLL